MNRRDFLRGLGGLGAPLFLTPSTPATTPNQRKPNILFILVDDLGAADLACYGADLHETPNVDRLAAQSVKFTRAYAASPVCTPARAALLTGKHPARLHMTTWSEAALEEPDRSRKLLPPRTLASLPLSEVTFAEMLRGEGYRTAHIGKWHLGNAAHYPEQQGFDINIGGTLWGAPQTYFYPFRGNKHYGGEERYVPGLGYSKPGDYLTDRLTDEALDFLGRQSSQPFCLNLWYYTVHTPVEGKPDLTAYYRKKLRPGMNHTNAGYAAMVQSMDENVGRVLRKLDETGLAANTIVIFHSDNGGFINVHQGDKVTNNAPWRSGKGSLYEGGIRTPLLVRLPGQRNGSVCETPVTGCDLYATIAELTGAVIPASQAREMDGVSFANLLRNPKAAFPDRPLYFQFPHYYPTTSPVSAVIDGEWKLLEYFEDGRLELYHLSIDPGEQHDLAAKEPERARRMQRQLATWRARIGAPLPVRNPAVANTPPE